MTDDAILLTDDPAPHVRRLTLNRPAKRNALSNALRGEIFAALEAGDSDPEVRVIILRGAGTCFSSGYDLAGLGELPYHTAGGQGQWARHVVEGCFRIWDLAKPVIAQVHGWCLAGGSELAFACDLVYVAEDAQIGYPAVRTMSPPDNQYHAWLMGMRPAMELMLTGDSISGIEAVRLGFANRAFPAERLEARDPGHGRADRQGGSGTGPAQQAPGAPPDGGHGPARGPARWHRSPRPRLAHAAPRAPIWPRCARG